jgi:hypothetical protein
MLTTYAATKQTPRQLHLIWLWGFNSDTSDYLFFSFYTKYNKIFSLLLRENRILWYVQYVLLFARKQMSLTMQRCCFKNKRRSYILCLGFFSIITCYIVYTDLFYRYRVRTLTFIIITDWEMGWSKLRMNIFSVLPSKRNYNIKVFAFICYQEGQ